MPGARSCWRRFGMPRTTPTSSCTNTIPFPTTTGRTSFTRRRDRLCHIIDFVAIHPGITITELGTLLQKTPSACSQLVRRLRAKGWVEQTRNEENNRLYNLTLTESGMHIYRDHLQFAQSCQDIAFRLLSKFSTQELESHLQVQRRLIEAYRGDVMRSRRRQAVPEEGEKPPV